MEDLYQELVLDHYKRPRNCRRLEDADFHARGHNPLCGDVVTLWVKVTDGVVEDVAFEGSGCAISTASASLMTERIKGRPIDEAKAVFRKFHALVTGDKEHAQGGPDLGKLEVFAGVYQYPVRVKCAMLAWRTLEAALDERHEEPLVTTE